MPKTSTKTYPDHTFEDAARLAGATVRVLWEEPGPVRTEVAWNVAYNLNGRAVIVQTYKGGDGWNVFTCSDTNDVQASIADALARCRVTPDPVAPMLEVARMVVSLHEVGTVGSGFDFGDVVTKAREVLKAAGEG